ncbi:MAG: NifU family protein [Flavobacteriia bacterium]|jgi:Fe-S cluster biogenesis protein NfuA|nr:NifU family protein [Flavobacteriia bacterium]
MDKQDLNKRIELALEEIRPYLNNDGGDIELISIEGDVLNVRFLGNCTSCMINKLTLKSGVEMMVKKHAPEISKVVNVP